MARQGAQLFEHGVFHRVRWERLGRAAVRAQFLPGSADVVTVLLATDDAVGRGHGVTAQPAKEQALEQGIGLVMSVRLAAAVVAKQVLDLVPDIVSDDGLVFAVVDLVFIADLAEVGDVGEELVQSALGERPAATLVPLLGLPALGSPAQSIRFLQHPAQRTVLHVQGKELPDLLGFRLVDEQFAVFIDVVAQHGHATAPEAFAAGSSDLVTRSLRDDLTFELSKGQEHVENEPAHGGGRVELLGDRHEGDLMLVKDLHHLGEVEQRTR